LGILDRVVPSDEVEENALHWAAHLGRGAVVAMGLAKRVIDDGLGLPLAAGLDLESDAFVAAFGTEDARLGVQSFLEHGPGKAKFSGR
jgi:enoyl-CoA hydratase